MDGPFRYDNILYIQNDDVYPVESDSLLLARCVEKMSFRDAKVIDMGCGTGLVTLIAAYKGQETISVDREPRALELTRSNLNINGLSSILLLSDLFEGIPRCFNGWADMIVFNPPYLKDPFYTDSSRIEFPLTGGEEGWETAARFLEESHPFLSERGSIMMVTYPDWRMEQLDPAGLFYHDKSVEETVDLNGEILEVISIKPVRS